MLSNDLDSYLSCRTLTELFGLEIGGFYEFDSGLWLNRERTEGKEPIYVDVSIAQGKCFDNHYTFINNPQAVNPNIGVTRYNRKYNGSTLALVCALYDYPILESRIQLSTLLCIDGWYYGYYNQGGKYRDINLDWYTTLGMLDILLPILEKNDKKYFSDYIKKYELTKKIVIENKKLISAGLDLPDCEFELSVPVHLGKLSKEKAQEMYKNDPERIMSSAETYIDSYIISERNDRK